MALYDKNLREKISELPRRPGVYQYFDASGTIIYIGKAKNLKNRVSSYLSKRNQSNKTLLLVRQIEDLRYIVVDSEQDALLLENNLIKKYKPKYNILLKDDKSYPWICIKKEHFPRVFLTRQYIRDGSEYFGPYTSSKLANTLLNLIRSLFKLRTCHHVLDGKSIFSRKIKACLEYHIGNCLAPCEGRISQEEYQEFIIQIRNILKGNLSLVIQTMNQKMQNYSAQLKFEEADQVKKALSLLRNYQSKSTIVRTTVHDIDVFSYLETEEYAYINYLRVMHGAVIQVHSVELEKKIEEREAILAFAIYEIRQLMDSHSKEIIVPFLPDVELEGVKYVIPTQGDKKQLLDLSTRNASYFKSDRESRHIVKNEDSIPSLLQTIQEELKLPRLPYRIECFDNSNIQGTHPVSACTVFLNGHPAKREYRKFHVKTVVGADDFATMEEVIFRRYSRVLDEGRDLPDLIVIDGGKGQLHSALKSLRKLDLEGKIPILGLAERMEEIYFPGDNYPYVLGKNSLALKTLMHIRDEAHRFGITFHRKLREKSQTISVLSSIPGIGKETELSLLQQFKSVSEIASKSFEELAAVIGKKRAGIIYHYFRNEA
mgnify:FL=1